MAGKKSVRDVDVRGKRVFVRVDFNVPMENGRISDDTRIRASIPTIRYLIDQGAAVILASHLGRPKGQVRKEFSLAPAGQRLGELLKTGVQMAPDSIGPDVERLASSLHSGSILLLENLRFHAGEEQNSPEFARALARLADVYVDDAFGAAHRAHASTTGITAYLPSVAGLLMEKELAALGEVVHNPRHPLVAIIGGAKISTKIGVLTNLLPVADAFLIGGGMANTLLQAEGKEVGASLVEEDKQNVARDFLRNARARGRNVYLPQDVVVVPQIDEPAAARTVTAGEMPPDWKIVDIGATTLTKFAQVISGAGTVIWNGPMGIFEMPPYSEGTKQVAIALANSPATTVVGGGDSVAAVEQTGVADRMTHISTGGGASLEFLEGRVLPGVDALEDRTTGGQ